MVADARQQTDGAIARLLEKVVCPVTVVLMGRTNGFKFNNKLKTVGRYVLVEVSELGWDYKFIDSHTWGQNTANFPQYEDDEYKKFDDWVASNPPLFTLQRELLKKDVTDICKPIDYPCWYEVPSPQSRGEFNGRPISGFYFWGRSHEARLRLHSQIWSEASKRGFSVCDNPNFFERFVEEEKGTLFASMWMPHYGRMEMQKVLEMQQYAKVSIALPGAGVKTFRHTESSYNAVMLKWPDNLAWAYPWVDGVNCLIAGEGGEIDAVFAAKNLYETYCSGVENCRKYQVNNYVNNYLNPLLVQL